MKLSYQSFPWYDHEKPEETLLWLKKMGFEAVDFDLDRLMATSEMFKSCTVIPSVYDKPMDEMLEYFRPLKEALTKTGMEIGQAHGPIPVWSPDHPVISEHIRHVLDRQFAVCEYLGCPYIVLHPPIRNTVEEEWEANLQQYRPLIPIIQKYKGVTICLENIFGRKFSRCWEGALTERDYAALIDQLNQEAGGDYFGFCFDVGHALLAHKDLKRYVTALGHRLVALHLHENNTEEDLHYMPYACLYRPLSPTADWEDLLDGLHEIGYKGNVNFEMERPFYIYPKALHEDMMRFVAAIGRYFAGRIQG